jgi:ATP-dependent DNA helicase RecG
MSLKDLLQAPEGRRLEFKETPDGLRATNALLLLSDDPQKSAFFPYAKIECARFKGTCVDTFIDRKTYDGNVLDQVELAYEFVLRHINQSAKTEGVYTQSRWQYPVKAIREAIRNAVIHRDYSLSGKDIKIAIYDDMVEITSPGKLPPSVDFSQLEARQSEIRNKVIAPLFKHLGLIDQRGNGLKLMADELKDYPGIELKWSEIGFQFQVQFILKEAQVDSDMERPESQLAARILSALQHHEAGMANLANQLGHHSVSGELKKQIKKLLVESLIERTIPEKPNSRLQKYRLTEKGKALIQKEHP